MHRTRTFLAALSIVAPLLASAQTPPAAEPPPGSAPETKAPAAPGAAAAGAPAAAPAPKWYEAIEVHGLADAYYQVRLDAAQTNPAELRVFDDFNGFNLGYAKVSVGMAPAPAGFRVDLGYGRAADKITPATADDANVGGVRYVQQAYAAMKLGPAELNVGRFVTSAGAEVIEAKDNWLYSRSFLFGNIPFTHVGARATVTVLEGLNLLVGVNNGWDVANVNSPNKTLQGGFTFSKDATSLAGTVLYGKQPGATDDRTLLDGVVQQGFGPFAFNVNVDWFKEGAAKWWGVAAMARYSLPSDVARLSVRGEYVDDQKGFITGATLPAGVTSNKLYEVTGGVGVPVGANSELRFEIRYDKSDEKIFRAGADDKQLTGTIAALAWF